MGVEGEMIAGYMKRGETKRGKTKNSFIGFGGYCSRIAYLGSHGSLATAVPNSAPVTDLAKELRVPCQPLLLKFYPVTTRLLLALELDWFQEVCCSNCSTGFSWIPLKSTAAISLTQKNQTMTVKSEFCKKREQ